MDALRRSTREVGEPPAPLLAKVRFSVVPGVIAAGEAVGADDPLEDAHGALLPEAEVEIRSAVTVTVMRPSAGSQTR